MSDHSSSSSSSRQPDSPSKSRGGFKDKLKSMQSKIQRPSNQANNQVAEIDARLQKVVNERDQLDVSNQQLMDQLSNFSQKFADEAMAKDMALRQNKTQALRIEELTLDRDNLKAMMQQLDTTNQELKENMSFQKQQENQQQFNEVSEQNKTLQRQIEQLQARNDLLAQKLEKSEQRFHELFGQKESCDQEMAQLRQSLTESQEDCRMNTDLLKATQNELSQQKEQTSRHSSEVDTKVAAVRSECDAQLAELRSTIDSLSEAHKAELEKEHSDRDGWKRKCDGIAKELKKMISRSKKASGVSDKLVALSKENQILRDQIERKNQSMQDLIACYEENTMSPPPLSQQSPRQPQSQTTALSSSTQQQRSQSQRIVSPSQSQASSVSSASKLSFFRRSSESKVPASQLVQLQLTITDLSENIRSREENIRSLRFANAFLGKRVLELEQDSCSQEMAHTDFLLDDTASISVNGDAQDSDLDSEDESSSSQADSTTVGAENHTDDLP